MFQTLCVSRGEEKGKTLMFLEIQAWALNVGEIGL